MGVTSLINWRVVARFMCLLLIANGTFMLAVSFTSLIFQDGVFLQMLFSSLSLLALGGFGILFFKKLEIDSFRREGYFIVTFGWILMALTGCLPYLTTQVLPSFTDAFFETMSGYSTVGASIIPDLEQVPQSVLLWRSITQWIGGMGMIVLAIAILPMLGIGGMQLFAAEAPGVGGDKLHPRITDTAKRLWLIYIGLTTLQAILLKLAGMSVFDAINHSLTTLATGGFSTKNESIIFYNNLPMVQVIITVFMFLGAMNFILTYHLMKGRIRKVFSDEEFRAYVAMIVGFSVVGSVLIYFDVLGIGASSVSFLETTRHVFFQITSVISTTGFVSVSYDFWSPFVSLLFFALMFVGGSAQSTAGGVKIVRHLILIKNGILEFKRAFHPRAVLPVRYNQRAVEESIVSKILAFFTLYMLIFVIGVLGFSILGVDSKSAIASVASALGNVGGAFGDLSVGSDFTSHPSLAKWWAVFLMLIGRLELFTVLILFTPYFWKRI